MAKNWATDTSYLNRISGSAAVARASESASNIQGVLCKTNMKGVLSSFGSQSSPAIPSTVGSAPAKTVISQI